MRRYYLSFSTMEALRKIGRALPLAILLVGILNITDRKTFPLLYQTDSQLPTGSDKTPDAHTGYDT